MGRSYWFECGRCGYRAKVSGRADEAFHLSVQTIICQECKELYDAVTRIRILDGSAQAPGKLLPQFVMSTSAPPRPPHFQWAFNRLRYLGERRSDWLKFPLQCPVSPLHKVEAWNDPGKCPRCGLYLEKNALPYRIWD